MLELAIQHTLLFKIYMWNFCGIFSLICLSPSQPKLGGNRASWWEHCSIAIFLAFCNPRGFDSDDNRSKWELDIKLIERPTVVATCSSSLTRFVVIHLVVVSSFSPPLPAPGLVGVLEGLQGVWLRSSGVSSLELPSFG